MKRLLVLQFFLLQFILCVAQTDTIPNTDMSNEKLGKIFESISEEIDGANGSWQFIIDSTLFICLTDTNHNRMRIISPVEELNNMTEKQILKCLEANFHTVLDSKYAISDGILWSVFIHPLKELTEEQVVSAITQVYSGVKTYGTLYSSGMLSFPKAREVEEKKEKDKIKKS